MAMRSQIDSVLCVCVCAVCVCVCVCEEHFKFNSKLLFVLVNKTNHTSSKVV